MITPIDIGSESISHNWWMSFGFFRFRACGERPASALVDPVTGAPPKNGKPLLLSYLVVGVKESTLLKAILGERGKKDGQAAFRSVFNALMHPDGVGLSAKRNPMGKNRISRLLSSNRALVNN